MHLFQWGTYRWRGTGPEFEINLTRQFIVNGLVDDDAFFQLSGTALFPPSDATAALGEGNRWCHHPDDVDDFLGFILGSEAATFATLRSPDRVEIDFGPAG
jgi:hypothetical protein